MGSCRGAEGLLRVEEPAFSLGVRVAVNTYSGRRVGDLDPSALDLLVEEVVRRIQSSYSLENLKSDPVVRAYRDFYWRIGVDPTKTRPSGEALVRRILRGRFPRINPVVDAGNIASALTLVSIGIYDIDRFEPPARITTSKGGEMFHPIGGKPEALRPGIPVLIDARGVVMHVYPHRDSIDTSVTESTQAILAVAAGVPGVPGSRLLEALSTLEDALRRLGWRACGKPVLFSSP